LSSIHPRAGAAGELVIEGGEMWPVLRLVERGGGDRSLEDVDVATAEHEGAVEHRSPFRDLGVVPERAVLVAKEDRSPHPLL
jgi:hypothetical protein